MLIPFSTLSALAPYFFQIQKHFCGEVGKRMFIFPTDSCSHMISSIPLWLLILFSNIYSPAALGCTKSPLSFQIYGRNRRKSWQHRTFILLPKSKAEHICENKALLDTFNSMFLYLYGAVKKCFLLKSYSQISFTENCCHSVCFAQDMVRKQFKMSE